MNLNVGNPMFGAPTQVVVNPPIVTRTVSAINRVFVVEQPYIHEHVTNIINHNIRRNICCYKPLCCEQNTFCEQNVNCCPPPACGPVPPVCGPNQMQQRPFAGGAAAPQQFQ